jgi:hypothetical protein
VKQRAIVPLLVLVLSAAFVAPSTAAPAQDAGATVELDRATVTRKLGQSFTIASTVRNTGQTALTGVVLHLNVVGLDPSVYVDPEDWSSSRTRYVKTIAPGSSISTRWSLKAVTGGRLVVYVTALPENGAGAIAVSPPLHVEVTKRRTLNPGGVVPLVVAVPGILIMAAVARRFAFTRRRGPARDDR